MTGIEHAVRTIEVFKTNVHFKDATKLIIQNLLEHFPESRINFDLNDCDKILRVEGNDLSPEKITEIVKASGFHAEILS